MTTIPPKMPPSAVQTPPAAREAWSLDRFVAAYNAEADHRGGWYFQPTPAAVKRVEREWGSTKAASIEQFARDSFRYDQRT